MLVSAGYVGRVGQCDRQAGGVVSFDFVNTTSLSTLFTHTRASSATAFNSSGTLVTVSSDVPRFDYNPSTLQPRGLLLEGARTNSIRNGDATGAVVGAPGTLPTNWSESIVASLAREIVGFGTENGIAYVDIRVSGTPSASGTCSLRPETTTGVTATLAQTWAASSYIKATAGSGTNITNCVFSVDERTAAGSFLTRSSASLSTTVVATPLAQVRQSHVRTTNNASVERVTSSINFDVTSGSAIDITFRIGGSQLELGSFASSYIPTTTAAATRASDLVIGSNLAALGFNASEGTFFIQVEQNYVPVASRFEHWLSFYISGSSANTYRMLRRHTTGVARFEITSGGASQGSMDATVSSGIIKHAAAYRVNDCAASANGSAVATDTTVTLPVGPLDRISLGTLSGATGDTNQCEQIWFRGLTYTPNRQPDAVLPVLSA